jgi:hypothetical protein
MVLTPLIVAGLIIAAVWALYLLPSMFGDRRDAPLSSAEEFDRLTRLMADVQKRQYDVRKSSARNLVRIRRRRTVWGLALVASATLALAWKTESFNWLLVHLLVDVLIAWYVAMLVQLRQRQAARVASRYFAERPDEWSEAPVRVIARH